ncbi:MAG TPA: hypothetical protein VHY83_11310 [Solirubrobacteraceae bacterium]|jgi:hypothetical protein|nr:hypothetical protein [Solirubrobacteraceae bacterium]
MRVLFTVPWGERLGGAEAMLHGVLEEGRASEHELEAVFFTDGPWVTELREAGLRVEVVRAGRLREAHRWLLTVVHLARLIRARRPDVIVNWSAKTQLYGAPPPCSRGRAAASSGGSMRSPKAAGSTAARRCCRRARSAAPRSSRSGRRSACYRAGAPSS